MDFTWIVRCFIVELISEMTNEFWRVANFYSSMRSLDKGCYMPWITFRLVTFRHQYIYNFMRNKTTFHSHWVTEVHLKANSVSVPSLPIYSQTQLFTRLCGTQIQSGCCCEEKYGLESNLDSSVIQSRAESLHWLSYSVLAIPFTLFKLLWKLIKLH